MLRRHKIGSDGSRREEEGTEGELGLELGLGTTFSVGSPAAVAAAAVGSRLASWPGWVGGDHEALMNQQQHLVADGQGPAWLLEPLPSS